MALSQSFIRRGTVISGVNKKIFSIISFMIGLKWNNTKNDSESFVKSKGT